MKKLILCLATTACSTNVSTWEEFVPLYTQEKCLVYKQCYRAHYEGEYGNYQECERSVSQEKEQSKSEYETCTFAPDKANACLEQLGSVTCGSYWSEEANIYKACHEDIWTCSSD